MTFYGHSPIQVLKLERVPILTSTVLIVGSSRLLDFNLLEHPLAFAGICYFFALITTLDLRRKIKRGQ